MGVGGEMGLEEIRDLEPKREKQSHGPDRHSELGYKNCDLCRTLWGLVEGPLVILG